jgi:hypothetical protein
MKGAVGYRICVEVISAKDGAEPFAEILNTFHRNSQAQIMHTPVYDQVVEQLDLTALIAVVNGLAKPGALTNSTAETIR